MAVLYYADFSSVNEEEILNKYTDMVDRERLSKITRTRDITARVRSLLAGYLLQKAVKERCEEVSDDKTVLSLTYRYGKCGKPYLAEHPDLYFSLSHSGNVVACLVAEQEVGLDVQQYVKVKEGLATRFFSKEECEQLAQTENKQLYEKLFFRMWSIKESYIKYTGQGMSRELDSFTIDWKMQCICDGNNDSFYSEIEIDNLERYAVCACMRQREEIEVIKVEI